MENSKSGAVVEDANEDMFEMIKRAIMVAASDHPTKFQTRRHEIAQTLLSDELINRSESCDNNNCLKDETNVVSNKPRPRMLTLKLMSGAKFQIPMGPVTTPEKKVDDHGSARVVVYSDEVAEVLRIKKILDKSDECELSVVYDLLKRLQSMGLSVETLEATMIGKTVSALKKHASEEVRESARTLVKAWRRTVDQSVEEESNNIIIVQPMSHQVKPTDVININTDQRKLESSEKASKINGGVMMDYSKKMEAAKRKLREGYEKVENMKKKRRVQVMALHEVMKQGLLPPHIHEHSRRRVYGQR